MKSNRLVYFQHSLLRSANTHPYTRFLTPIKSTEVSKIKNKPAFKTRVWAYGEVLTVSYCKASSIHQPLFFPWHLFSGLLDKNRKQKYTHYESAKVFECNSIFPKGKQRPCQSCCLVSFVPKKLAFLNYDLQLASGKGSVKLSN